jgi:hypothetical protein
MEITTIQLTGPNSGNYSLTQPTGITVNIIEPMVIIHNDSVETKFFNLKDALDSTAALGIYTVTILKIIKTLPLMPLAPELSGQSPLQAIILYKYSLPAMVHCLRYPMALT